MIAKTLIKRKLKLQAETLRQLSMTDLVKIHGGITSASCPPCVDSKAGAHCTGSVEC
jgi:hypothetical protein